MLGILEEIWTNDGTCFAYTMGWIYDYHGPVVDRPGWRANVVYHPRQPLGEHLYRELQREVTGLTGGPETV